MIISKHNIKRPANCLLAPYMAKESDGVNKVRHQEGNGRQRDFTAYDLKGRGTFTNLVNQLDVTTFRHIHSTGTEAQIGRILAKMKRIDKALPKASPDKRIVLNALLDRLQVRLVELNGIIARRKPTRLNVATK